MDGGCCVGHPRAMRRVFLLLVLATSCQGRFFRGNDEEKPYLFSDPGSPVVDLDMDMFHDETEKSGPLLVNFYAHWCGHCQHFAPVYKNLAAEFPGVRFTAVSCTPNSLLCSQQSVHGYPTIKAFGFPGKDNGFVVPNRRAGAVQEWLQLNTPSASGGQGGQSSATPDLPAVKKPTQPAAGDFDEADVEGLREPRISDALMSVVFAFEKEVFRGVNVLEPDVLQALRSFLRVLSLSFPGVAYRRAFSHLLTEIDGIDQLDVNTWDEKVARLIRAELLPKSRPDGYKWGFCNQAGKNGYTCGLWTLFHILTVKSGPASGSPPRVTMEAIHDFVEHFFGCAMCRSHFLSIYDSGSFNRKAIEEQSDSDNHALVLWLWEFHNGVNVRVAMEGAAATALANGEEEADFNWDKYRSELWPSVEACPECWRMDEAERGARVTSFQEFDEDKYAAYIQASAEREHVYRRMMKAYAVADSLATLAAKEVGAGATAVLTDAAGYYATMGALCVVVMLLILRYRSVWKLRTLTGRHKKVDSWMASRLLP